MINIEQIQKRDGHYAPFEASRIYSAVFRCLTGSEKWEEETATPVAVTITSQVVNLLLGNGKHPLTVEHVQDLVEEQLMALGHYDAARSYIRYRQKREQQRRDLPIPEGLTEKVAENRFYLDTPLREFQFYDKYARRRDAEGRRETWPEAVERVVDFLQDELGKRGLGHVVPDEKWAELEVAILNLDVLPSMRILQTAGPALVRCNVGAYNCAYVPLDSSVALSEFLYILMQGTGCGYSVESDYVGEFPRVKKQKGKPSLPLVVPDSTEGWCDAFRDCFDQWMGGGDVAVDTSRIRPAGARLRTKGGRASGPQPLRDLLNFTRARILARQGSCLTTLDVSDVACKAAGIVEMGGFRRAATLGLGDLEDELMRTAKFGQFWNENPQRSQANISAVYDERPTATTFMREWYNLASGGTGERGIFNRAGLKTQIPRRRKWAKFGVNPCGEIILNPNQFCNCSQAVAKPGDTAQRLIWKAALAAFLGTVQSLLTRFGYLRDVWRATTERERLLGVDISAALCNPYLVPGAANGRTELLRDLKRAVENENQTWARRFGIPASPANTTVKPQGNSGELLGGDRTLTVRPAPYYIRRCRASVHSATSRLLMDSGVPWFPENGQTVATMTRVVFEFPMKAPDGALTVGDVTALQQLENWLAWKEHYTEHNPSCTIYVKDSEWFSVGNWVYEHFDSVGGLSFFPADGAAYPLQPNEPITKEEYERRASAFPEIDYAKMIRYGDEDEGPTPTAACAGGACEL